MAADEMVISASSIKWIGRAFFALASIQFLLMTWVSGEVGERTIPGLLSGGGFVFAAIMWMYLRTLTTENERRNRK